MKRSNVSVAARLCVYVTLSGEQKKVSEEVASARYSGLCLYFSALGYKN